MPRTTRTLKRRVGKFNRRAERNTSAAPLTRIFAGLLIVGSFCFGLKPPDLEPWGAASRKVRTLYLPKEELGWFDSDRTMQKNRSSCGNMHAAKLTACVAFLPEINPTPAPTNCRNCKFWISRARK